MPDNFTEIGREAAKSECRLSPDGAHKINPVMERLGTFGCLLCGAVAPDSIWVMEDYAEMAKTYEVDCPSCQGTGYSGKTKATCRPCKGTGKVKATI